MQKTIHIFDLDGTLTDSMPFWAKGIYSLFENRQKSYPDDLIIRAATMETAEKRNYFASLGVNFDTVEQMTNEFNTVAAPYYANEVPLKDGVKEYLLRLKGAGARLFVLSASPHVNLDPCLTRCGVFDLFEKVWSVDDFSLSKSDVKIYRSAIQQIGCATKDAVFYDDNLTALETAKKVGLFCVGVYDAFSQSKEEKIKRIADKYVHSFNEL